MGVHFTVTVEGSLHDTSLDAVRCLFDPLQSTFDAIGDQLLRGSPPDAWRDVTECGSNRSNHFYAPAGFSLRIGPRALRFHHCTKFSTFVENRAVQDLLRAFSWSLSSVFTRRRVLYAPCAGIGDEIADWLDDGLSMAEMETRLRSRGLPATTIEALGLWPEPRYYFDDFLDLHIGGNV